MPLFFAAQNKAERKNVADNIINNVKNVAKIQKNILNNVAKDVYNIKKKTMSGV